MRQAHTVLWLVSSLLVALLQEAIAHEYFEDIRKEASSSSGNLGALLARSSGDLAMQDISGAASAAAAADGGGSSDDIAEALDAEIERQQHEDEQMEDWEGGQGWVIGVGCVFWGASWPA
jgi:hypothetical protein